MSGRIFGYDSKRDGDNFKVRNINTLQKLMFSRASNFKNFLGSKEIERLLSSDVASKNRYQLSSEIADKRQFWNGMSLPSLLLENKFVPILK
jgi:hypothetical protein